MTTHARALRVLVTDDDPMQLRVAARLLRSLGHHGALANQGAVALDLLGRHIGLFSGSANGAEALSRAARLLEDVDSAIE